MRVNSFKGFSVGDEVKLTDDCPYDDRFNQYDAHIEAINDYGEGYNFKVLFNNPDPKEYCYRLWLSANHIRKV